MTAATRTLSDHGTYRSYTVGGCRCPECTEASRVYNNQRDRLIAYGRWDPLADAEPVREHLRYLASKGVGERQAARLAGVPYPTVNRTLRGVGGNPPSRRIKTESAVALLAVRPTAELLATRTPVVDLGCTRRVQALVAAGFPLETQGRLTGRGRRAMQRAAAGQAVYASTVRAVYEAFERVKGDDPRDHGVTAKAVTHTRRRAAEAGWPTPQQWAEDIDDPDADPLAWVSDGHLPTRVEDVVENAEWLHAEYGLTWEQIADRLKIRRDTLHQYRTRVRERAAASAAPEPS